MILDAAQIKEIILTNPNKSIVDKARLNNKKLRMHLYGEGMDGEISNIPGHEGDELKSLRKKYAKSNRDLFARMSRPIDKVFSARGGSVYYNLNDIGNKQAIILSTNVKDGLSIRKWIESKWKPHHLDDPNGVIFMEIGENAEVYPTYKSTTAIYDYLPSGSSLEYIALEVPLSEKIAKGFKKEDCIYRLVDDAFDYLVKKVDENVIVLQEHTYPNYFGKVPAILNSDFVSPETEGIMYSFFSDVIELANDFLQTGSIRNLAKIRLAYPKYWEYADDCSICHGEGITNGESCHTCKGTGKNIMIKPGDAKLLVYPDSKETPLVTPNVAGFVAFPKEYFDYSTIELSDLENIISLTIWGTETKKQTAGPGGNPMSAKTATQVIDEIQPKADRLTALSEMAEKRHKFIMDHIIQIAIDSSYKGASVNYGRRYMIEGPDVIWQRYSDARLKGAAISILDDLLMEYIEAKYNGDAVSMDIQTKLLMVEPFVHFTVQQVQSLNASFEDYNRKLYFGEWLGTINEGMLLFYTAEELKQLLLDYVAAKNLVESVKQVNPAFN